MSEPFETSGTPVTGSRFARAHHILLYFLGGALVIWLLTGFYQVQTGQYAIVERLGEYLPPIDGSTEHGLHYHLPWPIERVSLISMQQQYTLQVDEFSTSKKEYADFKLSMIRQQNMSPQLLDALFDPYVVTGDQSVVHVQINILFLVNDPLAWLQSVSHEYAQDYDPGAANDMRNQLFQQIAQRAIVDQVGHMTLNTLLQEGRQQLGDGVMKALQDALDHPSPAEAGASEAHGGMGVTIQSVTVVLADVPDAVAPAYRDLVAQLSRKQAMISNAEGEHDAALTKARGETSTLIAEAEAYRQNTVQGAQAEANRFSEVLKQYENAPALTRINLAVEAGSAVYGGATRIFFAQPGQSTNIFINPPEYNAAQTQPRAP